MDWDLMKSLNASIFHSTSLRGWSLAMSFDVVLSPGNITLLSTWLGETVAERFRNSTTPKDHLRLRQVRTIRDYGIFDRREAPGAHPRY